MYIDTFLANAFQKLYTSICSHYPIQPVLCTNTCKQCDKQASALINEEYRSKLANTKTTNPSNTLETMQQQETDMVLVTTYTLHEKNSTYIFLACTKNIRMSDTPLPNHNAHKIKTKRKKQNKKRKRIIKTKQKRKPKHSKT